MASFNDLGLREALLMVLEEEGIDHPTGLQQAAVPVLRREGNLVARAASGSGKMLAWALGVLDRIEARETSDEDEAEEADGDDDSENAEPSERAASATAENTGTRVLVLRPTAESAEETALALVPYAHA